MWSAGRETSVGPGGSLKFTVIVSGTVSKISFQELSSDGDFKACFETGSQEAFSKQVSDPVSGTRFRMVFQDDFRTGFTS